MRCFPRRASRLRSRKYAYVVLGLTAVAACGGDDNSPRTWDLLDGGSPSIDAALEASVDASQADADGAAAADGGLASGSCEQRASGAVVAQRFFDPQSPISVAVDARGALVSWSQYEAGKSRAFSRWFGLEGSVVDAPSIEDDSEQGDVHSVAIASGFFTTWSAESSGGVGLLARRSGSDGATLDATPLTLASDAASPSAAVAAQGADGNILVVFLRGTTPRGSALLLAPDGTPLASAVELPALGAIVGRPALAALGAGYVLAWVPADTRRVQLLSLGASGVPASAGVLADSEGNAQGSLDLATTASAGALTWDVLVDGVRPEVRLRTFDASGAPTGIEQTLTPYPETGLRPSLVASRGGYVVAYRSALASSIALQLVLVDGHGKRLSSEDNVLTVASLLQQDQSLALRINDEGTDLLLGWLDQMPTATDYELKRAWIGCD